jgi:hypothetical protein
MDNAYDITKIVFRITCRMPIRFGELTKFHHIGCILIMCQRFVSIFLGTTLWQKIGRGKVHLQNYIKCCLWHKRVHKQRIKHYQMSMFN